MSYLTLAGSVILAASVACFAALPTLAQPEPNPDTTAAVGLTFKDADIARAVQDFEAGKVQEPIDFLMNLVKDKAAKDQERTKELRTAAAMLMMRTMEVKQKQHALAIVTNIRPDDSNVARRAQVIRLVGDAKVKDGTKGIDDLKPRDNWFEHLRQIKRYFENEIEKEQKSLERCVSGERWGGVRDALKTSNDCIERMEVIRLDLDSQLETIAAHARHLAQCARDANGVIADRVERGSVLRDQIPGAHPRSIASKKAAVNAEYRRARDAAEAAERIIKAHNELHRRYPSKIKFLSLALHDIPRDVR